MTFLFAFAVGGAGAACLELMKFWELQGKLSETKFRKLLRSGKLWSALGGLILASGFITWAYFARTPNPAPLDLLCVGAAPRSVLRQGIASTTAHTPTVLDAAQDDFLLTWVE